MTQDFSLIAVFAGDLQCTEVFSGCNQDFDKYGGIILWFLLMLYMFKLLGVICDEYFVPSLETIVERLQVSNDVAGATFMAAGSSAPELFTSLVSTFIIVNAGGVGTIVGSAIFNILVMNGVTAFVACKEQDLLIWWYPLVRDCSFYIISILELVVFLADEEVRVWEGLLMVLTYILYCLYMKFNPNIVGALGLHNPNDTVEAVHNGNGKDEEATENAGSEEAQGLGRSSLDHAQGVVPHDGQKHAKWSYRESCQGVGSRLSTGDSQSGATEPPPANGDGAENPAVSGSEGKEEARCSWCKDPLVLLWEWTMPAHDSVHGFPLFSLSILWIGICTYCMVDTTHRIGTILTIDPFVMGLIFLAAGTSIPDTLGSIAVAKQGEGDMAIANALGSNVFDILIGLGVPWTLRAMAKGKVQFDEDSFDDFIGDIVILIVALVAFVACLSLNKWKLNRKIGGVLIVFYVVFVLYQILAVFAFGWKEVKHRRRLFQLLVPVSLPFQSVGLPAGFR